MTLYDAVADLPLTVEAVALRRHEAETSSDFTRVTTVVELIGGDAPEGAPARELTGDVVVDDGVGHAATHDDGRGSARDDDKRSARDDDSGAARDDGRGGARDDGRGAGHVDAAVGRGEDVTYDAEVHEALHEAGEQVLDDLTGEWTFDGFSSAVGDLDRFPEPPESESARHYRRWGIESAGLDLALRQAGTSLAERLGREQRSVRFVASTRLGDPPTTGRIDALRARYPDVDLKLDPTPGWDEDLVGELRARGGVSVLDLKGHYDDPELGPAATADFYGLIVGGFPDAVIEDPLVTDETRPVLADHEDRVAWDAPVTGLAAVDDLPWPPRWLNVKPSRFGSVRSLFETLEWAIANDVTLYGGGQFELSVGRGAIQELASLFYPRGPNDVAPSVYNLPDLPPELPHGPLTPPVDHVGFGWPV